MEHSRTGLESGSDLPLAVYNRTGDFIYRILDATAETGMHMRACVCMCAHVHYRC